MMVYAVHSNDADSDSKVWIAAGDGMLLGQDMSFNGDGKTMRNGMSVRYDYSNVQPPKM